MCYGADARVAAAAPSYLAPSLTHYPAYILFLLVTKQHCSCVRGSLIAKLEIYQNIKLVNPSCEIFTATKVSKVITQKCLAIAAHWQHVSQQTISQVAVYPSKSRDKAITSATYTTRSGRVRSLARILCKAADPDKIRNGGRQLSSD